MRTNRKGLNEAITTVLIILLVIIAIGILWFFIRPLLFDTSEETQKTGSCLDTTIEPLKCEYTPGDGQQRHIFLSIQRQGKAIDIAGYETIFTTNTGQTKSYRENASLFNMSTPKQFETQTPIIQVGRGNNGYFIPKTVKTAVVLSNKGKVCPSYSVEIDCKPYTYTKRSANINGDVEGNSYLNGDDFDLFALFWYIYDKRVPGQTEFSFPNSTIIYPLENVTAIVDFNKDLTVTPQDFIDFQSAFEAGYCPECN